MSVPESGLYQPLDWVLVRAPLLPVEWYLSLRQDPQDSGGQRAQAGPLEPIGRILTASPHIAAALAVGSPSLYEALERSHFTSSDGDRRSAKLLRYLIRMSTRPTPYGLFAGVGIAHWGPGTSLSIAAERPRTRTRPDMAWLLSLVFELESRPEIRAHLRYLANPRAFARAGRVFLPARAAAGEATPGPAVSVRATSVVARTLALARTPISYQRLVAELLTMPGATSEKAAMVVEALWRQTFLLTDLRPPLTNAKPAEYVAGRLAEIPPAAAARDQLARALAAMAAWDNLPLPEAAPAYLSLAASGDSGGSVAAPQVDMALPLQGRDITRTVASEAARAAELLLRLTPLPDGQPHLAAYREAFEARYGQDREVPMLELLDPDFGLGPPSAQLHAGQPRSDSRKAELRQRTLLGLAVSAIRKRQLVVDLNDDLLARLETCSPRSPDVPRSLDLSLFVIAASAAELDAGRFQIVIGPEPGAPAAGRTLGRFADLLGDEALAGLKDIAQAEMTQDPAGLWAELVYLPHRFRLANVAVRAHPRPYEISLGTTPGVASDHLVPLEELVIGVREGRFYVRWPGPGAEVFACAGHMLKTAAAPDACRFLDDIRSDGQAQFSSFDWGQASLFPVLPRLQAGRIVLCPARWRLDCGTWQEFLNDSPRIFSEGLAAWRGEWQVPRHVYLSTRDNRLLLDLEDRAQANELRAEMRKLKDGEQIVLEEALPGPGTAWMPGPGGHFVNEIVVPLVLRPNRAVPSPRFSPPLLPSPAGDRVRAPGSDWLFAKLYGPRVFEDDVLAGPVYELCQQALASGIVDDWFFIRYADPDPHLRLRFRGQRELLIGQLASQICSCADVLINEGLRSRLCFDTYERELERYGGPVAIGHAEAIFGADSRFVVEFLRLSHNGSLAMDLTTLAVLSVDDLLSGLGASEQERLAWYRERIPVKTTAGEEYRLRQRTLRALLGDPAGIRSLHNGDVLARVLATRRDEMRSAAQRLNDLARTQAIAQPLSRLFRSFVHLHCNRLFNREAPAEDQILGLLRRTRYGLSQQRAGH